MIVFLIVTPCVITVVWPVEEEELLWCASVLHWFGYLVMQLCLFFSLFNEDEKLSCTS